MHVSLRVLSLTECCVGSNIFVAIHLHWAIVHLRWVVIHLHWVVVVGFKSIFLVHLWLMAKISIDWRLLILVTCLVVLSLLRINSRARLIKCVSVIILLSIHVCVSTLHEIVVFLIFNKIWHNLIFFCLIIHYSILFFLMFDSFLLHFFLLKLHFVLLLSLLFFFFLFFFIFKFFHFPFLLFLLFFNLLLMFFSHYFLIFSIILSFSIS